MNMQGESGFFFPLSIRGLVMTKEEAVKYGIQILEVFPDDLPYRDVHWVLKGLLESVEGALVDLSKEVKKAG